MLQHRVPWLAIAVALLTPACSDDESLPSGGGSGGIGATTATGGTADGGGTAGGGNVGAGGGGNAGGGVVSGCEPKSIGYITDREVHTKPALPSLPAAGDAVNDPTFGTPILRVTDGVDGASCHNAYSYWPTFNADSTMLHLQCEGGSARLYDFDAQAFQVSNGRALFTTAPSGTTPGWEDSSWSDLEPTILFAHDTQRLYAYDVVAQTYDELKDFSSELGGGHVRQMSKSADDEVFGFTTQDGGWNTTGYLAWRRSDGATLHQGSTSNVDEVQVDKTGDYLVVKLSSVQANVESRVVELQTGDTEDLSDGAPDYGPGHSDNGAGTVVGAENWENRVLLRQLAAPHTFQTVLDGVDWALAKHVSMRAQDESWALVSTYQAGGQSEGVFYDELVQAATDGSGDVRRLVHHRSVYGSYWDSPRANISKDGCFVAFTSNWGDSGRRDVFLLDLSP